MFAIRPESGSSAGVATVSADLYAGRPRALEGAAQGSSSARADLTVARGQYIEGAQDDDWHDYNEGRPPIGSGPGRDRAHFTPRSTGHTSSRSSEANG